MNSQSGIVDLSKRLLIKRSIEQEMKLREKQSKMQEELNKSVIELNKARIDKLRNQEAPVLTINAPGLDVELEMVMMKILQNLQVKGNVSGMDMLFQGA